jgi:thymidylate synthase
LANLTRQNSALPGKVRHGLDAAIMRSNDIFRGLPYNFVQFTTMQEIMAGWLSLKVGSYNHFSDSLHVYESDFGRLEAVQTVKMNKNTDSLVLPKAEFDLVFADLEYHISSQHGDR